MKFLLDESVEYRLLSYLHQGGHDVTTIYYGYPAGLQDQVVLALTMQEQTSSFVPKLPIVCPDFPSA